MLIIIVAVKIDFQRQCLEQAISTILSTPINVRLKPSARVWGQGTRSALSFIDGTGRAGLDIPPLKALNCGLDNIAVNMCNLAVTL